ncbi:hypothetical protein CP500_000720 [Tychonema bourrellyi FEM_GT703]|uniref:Uncharacterized protein n=2 Tax=Tychonema bourrellyi TaxID=54313 RepID=A0A2G4F6F3_9CYAN|nr:hypothetical protein CP500_000720 [Tychonema bourrellyi FEM_GT703]
MVDVYCGTGVPPVLWKVLNRQDACSTIIMVDVYCGTGVPPVLWKVLNRQDACSTIIMVDVYCGAGVPPVLWKGFKKVRSPFMTKSAIAHFNS